MRELVKIKEGNIQLAKAQLRKLKDLVELRLQADLLEQEFREALLIAMRDHGIKKFDNDVFTAIYIGESERISIDTKKLKADNPELVQQYERTSKIKERVRIDFK